MMAYEKPLPKSLNPPSDQGSIKAFIRYKNMLESLGFIAIDHTRIVKGDTTSPEHLLWMCNYCIPQIRDDGLGFSIDKYSRWLGYVQGCLISQGYTTVEKERGITRPWFTQNSKE